MKTLKYSRYEKIRENFSNLKLTKSEQDEFKKNKWVVTEKIHGANFSIHTNGKNISFAKRKDLLTEGEDFFGHLSLIENLKPKILNLFSLIKEKYSTTVQISVYGEIFGGEYPHPDVPINKNVQAVQTGIYYTPNIEFCVFDIAFFNEMGKKDYLGFKFLEKFCKELTIFYTEALFIGKFEEAIKYTVGFKTKIPQKLGFPPLINFDNKAEGIVIKPYKTFFVETNKGLIRPVLKIKIPKFSEDKRYQQSKKWTIKNYENKGNIKITPEFLIEEVKPLVTIQRLNSAISKIGKLSKENREKIKQELINDVLDTLNENFLNLTDNMEKYELKMLIQSIIEFAKEIVK